MGWASSRPHNSHLTTPTWAAALSGVVLLNISVLMALFAIGPLDCDSQTRTQGGDPRQPQQMDTTLNCDPGVTPQEQSRVVRLSILGICLVLGGFLLGTIELVTRVVRNSRAGDPEPVMGRQMRRD